MKRDADTEYLTDTICFGEPVVPNTPEDVASGIQRALQEEAHPFFLEGVSKRLCALGCPCTPEDTETMLAELKRRYKAILGKPCPKAVQNWLRGGTPGFTNRCNQYDVCYALEMDLEQTALFFQKCYLSLPFACKSRVDAVFLYCLSRKRPYAVAAHLLEASENFPCQETAHTQTAEIFSALQKATDDESFLRILETHCYSNPAQHSLARRLICEEIETVKARIAADISIPKKSEQQLNSLTVAALLGYKTQYQKKAPLKERLPRRFLESLPDDVTLGHILNGDTASYETLRKTLMLLKFYNFYEEADNLDHNTIAANLLDFYEELDEVLAACGFAQLYIRHPFDCLLLYCANSYDPILTFQMLLEVRD